MWDKQIDSLEVSYATLVTAQEEAREEVQITSARNLLLAGFDAVVISNSLNLPLERVLQLQNELNANS
ncbi:TPA: hypothetical protein U1251_000132 [Streptococcus suis]|nr:hypothetical protein [Streptococcus suis]